MNGSIVPDEIDDVTFFDFTAYKKSAKYTLINGRRMAHWSEGKGEVILLIHGFPSAAWDWHYLWPHLKQSYQLLTLDLLGYGLSDKPFPHQYSLLEQADLIEGLLKHHHITQCHVLAHDYGNSVAQEILKRHHTHQLSFKVSSMCFLNGGLFPESHRPLLTQRLLKGPLGPLLSRMMKKSKLQKSFHQIFGPDTPPKEEEIDMLWQLLNENKGRRVLPSMLGYLDERKVHRDIWLEAMQQTTVPLRFINGVHDPISGQHMLERYKELIPNADAHGINVGHYPQLEAPDHVFNLYKAFLLSA
jgi:pimeloyl-ACP methyl ester carboxylesterase